jgi:hypothetical protein
VAVLSDTDRARALVGLLRQHGGAVSGNYSKTDLRAAVDATDTWIDTNAASFAAALPQPFRGQSTTQQKTILFCVVALRRAGLLPVTEDGA